MVAEAKLQFDHISATSRQKELQREMSELKYHLSMVEERLQAMLKLVNNRGRLCAVEDKECACVYV